jgi:lipid-binding SYLF domain-containing protein
MRHKKLMLLVVLPLLVAFQLVATDDAYAASRAEKRAAIDARAGETLERLFEKSPKAKTLYDGAYGCAVFGNWKFSFVVTGGGGKGVAVAKVSGDRTYMNMGTGGLNLGLGGQKYQVVFLFEDAQTFDTFVNKGWEAEASANAVAGDKGANASATFRNGMAVYQLTDGGLMLQADISGTKYWKSKLNGD